VNPAEWRGFRLKGCVEFEEEGIVLLSQPDFLSHWSSTKVIVQDRVKLVLELVLYRVDLLDRRILKLFEG
jgi:hypothetical protein